MPEHVTQRRMKAYVTGALSSDDRAAVEEHMKLCSSCRNRMLDEGAPLSEEELYPKRLRLIAFGAVAAFVLVGLIAMFWWTRSNLLPGTATAPDGSTADQITIRDGNGALILDHSGQMEATFPIPPEYEKEMATALSRRRLKVPANIAALAKGYPIGEPRKPGDFRIIGPVGTAVLTDRPVLVWETLPDAASYSVTITENGRTVQTSPALIDTRWETPRLPRGVLYQWNVAAVQGGRRVEAAPMPSGEPAFYILTETEKLRLEELVRTRPTNHLLLSVALAGAGAIEQAEEELATVIRNNPRVFFLKELLASLRPGVDTSK